MDIDEEIWARVRAAKVRDSSAELGHFQVRAAENGYVLINLKTGHALLIFDEYSNLGDLKQLFPNIRFYDFSSEEGEVDKSS